MQEGRPASEHSAEEVMDALSAAQRARFNAGEFDAIAKELQDVPQQERRTALRAYILAATEAMTQMHRGETTAGSEQEAALYRDRHDRLERFYETLMRENALNEE